MYAAHAVARTSSSSATGSTPPCTAETATRVGARSSLAAASSPAARLSAARACGPTTRNRHGLVRWWLGAQRARSKRSISVSRSTGSPPKTLCVRRVRIASSTSTPLLAVVVVEGLARQLVAVLVEELDVEQVAAVVVGRQEREAPVAQLALVDDEVGQLRGRDDPAGHQRQAPDQRHRRHLGLLAAPRAHHLVVEVELPFGVLGGGLVRHVGLGAEGARLAALQRGAERDVADELQPARRRRGGGDPRAAVPRAVGVEEDVAGLADVVECAGGGEELVA